MAINFIKNKKIEIPKTFFKRIKTDVKSIDYLFDKGIMHGMVLTVAGKHGSGKSQFMLQLIDKLQEKSYKVGYASCEETLEQIAFTCDRIEVDVPISNFESPDEIFQAMENLDVLIVDSFSMMRIDVQKGVRKYERDLIDKLYNKAKETKCCLFIVMHMTKSGDLKGSSYIPHKVDANLYVEQLEGEDKSVRKLYFTKNRFGCPNEIYIRMTDAGYDYTEIVLQDKESQEEPTQKKKSKIPEFDIDVDDDSNEDEYQNDDIDENDDQLSDEDAEYEKQLSLENDMQSIMQTEHQSIYMREVMPLLGKSRRECENVLNRLIAEGKVEKIGYGDGAIWWKRD